MDLRKKINNKILYYVTIFVVGVFFLGYNSASAATLQINSNSATMSPGGIMTLSVILNSEGAAINNAEAKIIFPKDLLEVVSVSKSGSVFSLWVEEPTYSNITGVITLNGGIPTPGFNGPSGTVLSIVVKAKTAGQADLVFSDATVRANDGLGTNVLNRKNDKTITIINKMESVPTETPVVVPSVPALQITSPTHPNQEQWYQNNNLLFQWVVPPGVDAVQTTIDNTTSGVPRVTYSPAISEKSVKDSKDGIWYFKVRARKDGKWGPTSTYIARIDTTSPIKNDVTFSYDDDKKILNINADIVDETSGLDYYEIYINNFLVKKVPSAEFVNGNYNLSFDIPGDNTVRLLAVDRAGNSVESLGAFQTTAKPEPEPVQPTISAERRLMITMGSFTMPVIYFVAIIFLIVMILVIGAFKFGCHYSKFRNKSKVRTALVKGDNTKVLLLLKKRLEKHLEILQNTRHNRILSKEEKDIKEAIESDLDELDKAIEEQKVK